MAVHAASVVEPGVVQLPAVVNRAWVPRVAVTPLAEERQLRHQRPVVRRSVRVVARGATLAHRRVLPQKGTALLRVAARAGFVQRVPCPQHASVLRPVRVVTGSAVELALADRHVTRAIELCDLVPVAALAGSDHGISHELMRERRRRVHAMAVGAGEIAAVVLAPLPVLLFVSVVARRTRGSDLERRECRGVPDKCRVPAGVRVRLAWTVTRLAALTGHRRPGVDRPAVRGQPILVRVAHQTGFGSGVLGARLWLHRRASRRGYASPVARRRQQARRRPSRRRPDELPEHQSPGDTNRRKQASHRSRT